MEEIPREDLIAYLEMARWAMNYDQTMGDLLDLSDDEIERLRSQLERYLGEVK